MAALALRTARYTIPWVWKYLKKPLKKYFWNRAKLTGRKRKYSEDFLSSDPPYSFLTSLGATTAVGAGFAAKVWKDQSKQKSTTMDTPMPQAGPSSDFMIRRAPYKRGRDEGGIRTALGIQQYKWLRPIKKTVKKYANFHKAETDQRLVNFSYITPNFGGSSSLGYGLNYQTPTEGPSTLPCYCWNLSTNPIWGYPADESQVGYEMPCFRLGMDETATKQFVWSPQIQNTPQTPPTNLYGIDTSCWNHELGTGAPYVNDQYIHAYTNLKLAVMGATGRQIKFHVMIVQFLNPALGPLRQYKIYDRDGGGAGPPPVPSWSGINYHDTNESADDMRDANIFWREFFSDKLNNPIYKPNIHNTPRRNMKIIMHDTFMIGPEYSTDRDTRGQTLIKKYFFKWNQNFQAVNEVAVNTRATNANIGLNSSDATSTMPTTDMAESDNVPEYSSNKWLLIFAENHYAKSTGFAHFYDPSFDFCLKQKFLYY